MAQATVLTCHLGKGHLHPHMYGWDSHLCKAGQGRLLLGTSLSGCGSKLTACEVKNFSSIVSIGLPSFARAELMEYISPAWTGNCSLCLKLKVECSPFATSPEEVGKHQMYYTNESATQGAADWPGQTVIATKGLTAEHHLSCHP